MPALWESSVQLLQGEQLYLQIFDTEYNALGWLQNLAPV